MGIKLFNKLPIQIKQLDDYKGFKREVTNFLLHNSFYTIEEFLHFEVDFSIVLCTFYLICY